MKVLKFISFLGLALTIIPSFLVFMELMEVATYKNILLAGTLIWFVTAPFWINKPSK